MTILDHAQTRAEARRHQILQAAGSCFAREGFHGTSMARIARVAGMSPGHIYHFFESKEAIIAALVELQLERSIEMVRQLESADDLFQAMIDRVEVGLNERTDLDHAALELEILAEAARNPAVAAIVRAADAVKRERLIGLHAAARRVQGLAATDDAAAVEVIMALFGGLSSRAVSHPELDKAALLPWLQRTLRALF